MPKHGGNSLAPYSGRNSIIFDIINKLWKYFKVTMKLFLKFT